VLYVTIDVISSCTDVATEIGTASYPCRYHGTLFQTHYLDIICAGMAAKRRNEEQWLCGSTHTHGTSGSCLVVNEQIRQ
jgi:hypothetical protein